MFSLHLWLLFFTSSTLYQQFLELCVTSYPSPLEDAAPHLAKLFLLAVAVAFEYIAALQLTYFLNWCTLLVQVLLRPRDEAPWDLSHIWFPLILSGNFVPRAGSLARCASRNGQGITARSVVMAIVRHNPALLCYIAFRQWMRWFDFVSLRMFVPKMITVLVAPMVKAGEQESFSWTTALSQYLIPSLLFVLFNALVLKHLPKGLVRFTLAAQSSVYFSRLKREALRKNGDLKERQRGLNKPALQNCVAGLLYIPYTVENLISWILSQALARATMTADTILDKLICRYYYTNSPILSRTLTFAAMTANMIPEIVLNIPLLSRLLPLTTTTTNTILRANTHSQLTWPIQESAFNRIRLLTLLPSTSPSRPIHALIHWHDISKTPAYTAISYSWNSTFLIDNIVVNGVSTPVTRSAYTALHALRSSFRSRTVWLDAICIDQTSDADKDQQIPLMPRIYAQATEVTIWLGPSKTAHLATALVDRLFMINRLNHSIDRWFDYEIDIEAARSLKRMFRRAWFHRSWVVQEVVRARGKVSVRYGQARLEWTRLSWFMQCLLRDKGMLNMLNERIGHAGLDKQVVVALRNVELMRRFALAKGGDPSLSLLFYLVQMFRSTCHFEARNPEDRVYALLGLSEVSSSTVFELKAEYRSNLQQLYIDIIHYHLATGLLANKLDFLAHAGIGYAHETPGLPSWVPDWSVSSASQPFLGTDGSLELLTSNKTRELLADAAGLANIVQAEVESIVQTDPARKRKHLYDAALVRAARVKDRILALQFDATMGTEVYVRIVEGNMLELRARRLGRVMTVGRCFEPPRDGNDLGALETLRQWIHIALDSADGERARGPDLKTDLSTFLKTGLDATQAAASQSFAEVICTGASNGQIDYTFTSTPERVDPIVTKLTQRLFENIILTDMAERIARESFQSILPSDLSEKHDRVLHDLLRLYAVMMSQNSSGKRFGIKEGGMMGLFVSGVEVGDEVVLIAGAKVPFVLREMKVGLGKNQMCYRLVGPAFVKGIMYGEKIRGDYGFEMITII